jgi:hypothetical protein
MRLKPIALAALGCAGVAGCRTTQQVLNDYEVALSTGNYAAPVQETSELAAKEDGSQLLWQLLAGGALYMSDDKERALAMFDLAEDAMHANDATSVFAKGGEGALAMMTNDRAFAYDGGGQDRIFACLYKAIDYMTSGRNDAARTELNRAGQHQENWLWERRKDIAAAAERMKSDVAAYSKKNNTSQDANRDSQVSGVLQDAAFGAQIKEKCGFDPMSSGNLDALAPKDYMNVYAEHVTGVFRWLMHDDARNYLKDVATLAAGNPVAARDFAEVDRGQRPSNQVWVYVEDGLCPCREEWRVDLPFALIPYARRYILYAGMALPYLRERAHGAISWSVAANGAVVPMTQLANMDALLKTEYDVYMRGALTREITRTLVRVGVQVGLGIAADHASDGRTQLALRISQAGVAAWAATATAADLRSWTALPKTVKVARLDRPADGKLEVVADGQRIQLSVPPGNTMVFIRKPGPTAYPVIKMATFR